METKKKAGFFKGIFHGVFAPLRLLIKIFIPKMKILKLEDRTKLFKFGAFLGILLALGSSNSTTKAVIEKSDNELKKKENLDEEENNEDQKEFEEEVEEDFEKGLEEEDE